MTARASVARSDGLLRAYRRPVRSAAAKRSAGSLRGGSRGGRHQESAPKVASVLAALTKNGTAMPALAVSTPPNAGPTARLRLVPALSAATAEGRSAFGTRSGTIACHAGASSAVPVSRRNTKKRRFQGVTHPYHTTKA